METVLIVAVVTIGNAFCLLLGTRCARGKQTEMQARPNIFQRAARKESKVDDRMSVIVENMENYDGTPYGQKDVPRG